MTVPEDTYFTHPDAFNNVSELNLFVPTTYSIYFSSGSIALATAYSKTGTVPVFE